MFKISGIVLIASVGVLLLFELCSWICALVCGASFKPFGIVAGVGFDNIAMIVMTVAMAAGCLSFYLVLRRKSAREVTSIRSSAVSNAIAQYSNSVLYGVLMLMLVLSAVLVFTLGENLMFMIPLTFATAAIILWRITSWKGWLPVSIAMILLHAYSFLYALAMALTIGAFGAVAMLAFLDVMLLIPMADIYVTSSRR